MYPQVAFHVQCSFPFYSPFLGAMSLNPNPLVAEGNLTSPNPKPGFLGNPQTPQWQRGCKTQHDDAHEGKRTAQAFEAGAGLSRNGCFPKLGVPLRGYMRLISRVIEVYMYIYIYIEVRVSQISVLCVGPKIKIFVFPVFMVV